jgi:hypothetical protein
MPAAILRDRITVEDALVMEGMANEQGVKGPTMATQLGTIFQPGGITATGLATPKDEPDRDFERHLGLSHAGMA